MPRHQIGQDHDPKQKLSQTIPHARHHTANRPNGGNPRAYTLYTPRPLRMSRMRAAAFIAITLALGAAAQPSAPLTSAAALRLPAMTDQAPAEYPGLHNVVAYATRIYTGSAPEGAAGFASLRALGFTTIISVDGAAPDVAAAKTAGLRYIHLPIGYNGMDRERTLQIAKAVRLASGPVYIHCHHGKHRAAGAAGAVAVTLGLLTTDAATAKLHVSGTAPQYTGLYKCVSVAAVVSAAELDAVSDDFPEVSGPTGLVQAMVDIDGAMDHLKAIEASGWSVPVDQPDLVPIAEAGRLADLFRAADGFERVKTKPAEFRERLADTSKAATQIEDGLSTPTRDAKALSAALKTLGQRCTDCHARYRD